MFASIALLFFLPWLDSSPVKSSRYRPLNRIFFWVLVADVLLLGVCGKMPAEQPWVILSQIGAAYYFAHLDRKSVVQGKSVSVRVDLGGRRIIKKKNKNEHHTII